MPETFVMRVLLFTLGVYLLQLLIGQSFTAAFSLTDTWWQAPWNVYRLVSYGFLHDPADMWHILWNMFALWMFGTAIEQKYGSREFLAFYLAAIVCGGLAWSLSESVLERSGDVTVSLLGASGGVVAVLILFVINFPKRTLLINFIIPVPAWVVGLVTVLVDINGAMTRTDGNVAFMAHLGGALFAVAYYTSGLRLGELAANSDDRTQTASRSQASGAQSRSQPGRQDGT